MGNSPLQKYYDMVASVERALLLAGNGSKVDRNLVRCILDDKTVPTIYFAYFAYTLDRSKIDEDLRDEATLLLIAREDFSTSELKQLLNEAGGNGTRAEITAAIAGKLIERLVPDVSLLAEVLPPLLSAIAQPSTDLISAERLEERLRGIGQVPMREELEQILADPRVTPAHLAVIAQCAWYFIPDHGPISDQAVRQLLASGQVTMDQLITVVNLAMQGCYSEQRFKSLIRYFAYRLGPWLNSFVKCEPDLVRLLVRSGPDLPAAFAQYLAANPLRDPEVEAALEREVLGYLGCADMADVELT